MDIDNILLEQSLYKKISFTESEAHKLYQLLKGELQIDAYCQKCNSTSTFNSVVDIPPQRDSISSFSLSSEEKSAPNAKQDINKRWYKYTVGDEKFFKRVFTCARNKSHKIAFFFFVNSYELQKIGQFPSMIDFNRYKLDKYRKFLQDDYYTELNRAIGLFSHEVGIGSFVYLRRIFERLIQEAYLEAEKTGWSDEEFSKRRMDEKIKVLKDFLPEKLVKNRIIYSILSKGIHELTEETCVDLFSVIKMGIELILDEKIAKEEREKKEKEIELEIKKRYESLQ